MLSAHGAISSFALKQSEKTTAVKQEQHTQYATVAKKK